MSAGEVTGIIVSVIVGMVLLYRIMYYAVKHAIDDAKVLRDIRDAMKDANRQPPLDGD